MLTVLCDENIAHLDTYFLAHAITPIKLAGRDITQSAIDKYNPDALLIRSVTPIKQNTIDDFKNIQFIGSATIGTDHVDTELLGQHGIFFANAKGCSKHSVAQYVISTILTLCPDFLYKKINLGIVGLGNIGSTLAKYANDLNWQIFGYDPYLPPSPLNNCSLDNLLKNSDVVSIHTPLTKHGNHPTYQLFYQKTLSSLKDDALLINSARGEIIHQDDLIQAINQKNIKAVLDVFPFEPTIDKLLLDKLTLATPHIAGYTLEGKLRGTDMIYQAFCQYFDLPPLKNFYELLPNNPHHWQHLKNNISLLKTYYDIHKDDKSLRAISDNQGIFGNDFDKLRKNYPLKREWLFDE